jgi:hypothetical protein
MKRTTRKMPTGTGNRGVLKKVRTGVSNVRSKAERRPASADLTIFAGKQ